MANRAKALASSTCSRKCGSGEMASLVIREGLVLGVDVGGTKVAAGLVDPSGEILCQSRFPMVPSNGAASGLAAVTKAIDAVSDQAIGKAGAHNLIHGIGICSPGPLDPKAGVVINPPNLPCWRNFPLAAELAQLYRVRVKVDNDANAAGLAETMWGAGRGYRNVFYVTLGTGIGTAIVIDGRIYHGRTGAAAEGGHTTIDYNGPRCGCGKRGCIEALASGPAIARRARTKLERARTSPAPDVQNVNRAQVSPEAELAHSALLDLAGGNPELITGAMVGQAHTVGDRLATEVLRETVELLAIWLGNIIDLLEPDVIIAGGGVSSMLKPLFPEIQDRLPAHCVNQRAREIPLLLAHYGEDAGIAGGAALCFGTNNGNGSESKGRAKANGAASVFEVSR
jgi:glucokinase